MSYDRKLDQVCTHRVVEEALFFDSDRLTLRPLRPISSALSVSVRINGVQTVPSSGSYLPALAKGTFPGPFSVRAGVNDTLVFSLNGGPDQTLTAPAGRALSASALAKALTSMTSGLRFETTKRLQIQARTATKGPSARLVFKTGSTLASTLGLVLNKVYMGQTLFSGWSLVNDVNSLSDRPNRLIIFDEALKGTNDYAEISYTTVRQECRRCNGTGVENDWRYNQSGTLIKARDVDLLSQEVLKISYTALGSNPFHTWYGTDLLESIGKKLSSQGLVQNMILSSLQDAFRRWQSIKRQQEENVGQFVSDEEYPFRLLVVNLEQDPTDPTVIIVNALIQNRANNPIQITRGLMVPEPTDLLGSSVQDSLLRQNLAQSLLQ